MDDNDFLSSVEKKEWVAKAYYYKHKGDKVVCNPPPPLFFCFSISCPSSPHRVVDLPAQCCYQRYR